MDEEAEKQEKLNSIYLFYGEETYLLENAVKKLKKEFGERIMRNKLYRDRRRKLRQSYARNRNALLWI